MLETKNEPLFINATHALANNEMTLSTGVSIFDIDGDGESEILVANNNSGNNIYKYNENTFEFEDISPNEFKLKKKQTLGFSIGDFFGKGIPCIYTLNSFNKSSRNKNEDDLFLFQEKVIDEKKYMTFKNLFSKNSHFDFVNSSGSQNVCAVDYEGEGIHGFLVLHANEFPSFYSSEKLSEEKSFSRDSSKERGLSISKHGKIAISQMILSKNASDILILENKNQIKLFTRGDKNNYIHLNSNIDLDGILTNLLSICVADFTGNGLADIVIISQEGNKILFHETPGEFYDVTPLVIQQLKHIRSAVVADFDNDGREEIFFTCARGSNVMFRYLGSNEWESVDIGELKLSQYSSTGCAYGDLTGSGRLDLFVASGEFQIQENQLFLGQSNGNYWLRVQPLTQFKFPALSAKVTILFNDNTLQTKFICSGSGYHSQMEPIAHFGFGLEKPKIKSLEVVWPGKKEQIFRTVIHGDHIPLNSCLQISFPFA